MNRSLGEPSERLDYNEFLKSEFCDCNKNFGTQHFKKQARVFNSSGVVSKDHLKFLGD